VHVFKLAKLNSSLLASKQTTRLMPQINYAH